MLRSLASMTVLLIGSLSLCAADPAKIQDAIKKGSEFLKKGGVGAGTMGAENYGTGPICLAGLALLETGTPPSDPGIQALAKGVRDAALRESKTYQIALDILFLDLLGDSIDVPLIQVLGCRLLAGQTSNGGWTYSSFPDIGEADALALRNSLYAGVSKDHKPSDKKGDPAFGTEGIEKSAKPKSTGKLHPAADRIYQDVKRGLRANGTGMGMGSDDNSNTQFGLIGVWVASRRGVPATEALQLVELRFVRSQSPTDLGWSYGMGGGGSTPSMTCAGLLGLAVGKAVAEKKPGSKTAEDKPAEDDPFFAPPKESEEDAPKPNKAAVTVRDRAIERALTALGMLLKSNGGAGGVGPAGAGGFGGVNDLYFFWSLERVGVAYGIETIGDVDWYQWGANQILASQQQDGSWSGSYNSMVSTSFALLFLAKANFTSDLTRQLGGKVKDPGGGEMRGTRGKPVGILPRGRSAEDVKAGPQLTLPVGPNLDPVKARTDIERYVDALVRAEEKDWKKRLDASRDRKGPEYTLTLVLTIPQLEGSRQYQARQALAERLTRMTPDTLRKMIIDRDGELRRAATLACAMRDQRMFVPDLIERLTDIDDSVVRAARAGLKSLTTKDFGPTNGANDEQKRKAADDWRFWWASEGRDKSGN